MNFNTKLGILLLGSALSLYSCNKGLNETDPTVVQPGQIDLGIEQNDSVSATDMIGSDDLVMQNQEIESTRKNIYSGLEAYVHGISTDYISERGHNVYLDNKDSLQFLYLSLPENTSFNLNLQDIFFGATLFDVHDARASAIELSDYTEDWSFSTGNQPGAVILKLFPQSYIPRYFNEDAFVNENSSFDYPSLYDSLTLGTDNFRSQVEIINEINRSLYSSGKFDNPIDVMDYLTQLDPAQYSDKDPSLVEEVALNTIRSNGIPAMIIEGYNRDTGTENWMLTYVGNYGWISSDPKNGVSLREFNPVDYAIKISGTPLPEGVNVYPISVFELQDGLGEYFAQLSGIKEEETLLQQKE